MYKIFLFFFLPFFLFTNPRILHLTFHNGCEAEINQVAKHFHFDLDTWNILKQPQRFLDPSSINSHNYIMTPARAQRIYERHKETFAQYDLIITSDIAPLSRIFLQNNWEKPLIVWVCNRFDINISPRSSFPDQHYYELFNAASTAENIAIIGYTNFEKFYAENFRHNFSITNTIYPTGLADNIKDYPPSQTSNREDKVFIRNYINEKKINLTATLAKYDIPSYCGSYAGSSDIAQFKAMVHIPVVMGNFFLLENLSKGIVHFIPSKSFYKKLYQSKKITFFDWTNRAKRNHNLTCEDIFTHSDWYNNKFNSLFIYFNSFDHLKYLLENTNFTQKKEDILKWHKSTSNESLQKWKLVFQKLLKEQL